MQIQVTDGYITGYATVGGFPDGVEVDDSFKDQLEDEKIGFYKYEGGKAVLDEEAWSKHLSDLDQENASQSEYIPSEQESMIVMVKAMLPTMEIKDDNTKLAVSGLYEVWEPGKYEVGEIRNWYDQTWNASRRMITRCTRTSSRIIQHGLLSGGRCTGRRREQRGRSCRCRGRMICTMPGNTPGMRVFCMSACRIRTCLLYTSRCV